MNPVADALEELMGLGVTGPALVAAIRRIESAAYGDKMVSLEQAVQVATDRADRETLERRRYERDRKAAQRAASRPSPDVPECPECPAMSPGVPGHPFPLPDKEKSPTPPKEINPTPLPPADASECADEPASAEEWERRLEEAKSVGGDGLNLTTPALHSYRDLRLLCEPTTGPACSWGDVLDAIRIEAAKAKDRGKPIRSWLWVHEEAIASRDRRLAGLPELRSAHELADRSRPAYQSAAERRQSGTESSLRAAALAIERRRGAGGGGYDGAG